MYYKARKIAGVTLDTRKIYENASRNITKQGEENIRTEECHTNSYIMKHALTKKMQKQEKYISSQVEANVILNYA